LISGLQYIGVTVEHCSSWYSTVNAQQLGAFIAINMAVTRTITAIVTMTLLTILLLSSLLLLLLLLDEINYSICNTPPFDRVHLEINQSFCSFKNPVGKK
jgi:hypothetical protein